MSAPAPLPPFVRVTLEAIGSAFAGAVLALLVGLVLMLMLAPVVFLARWVFR